MLSPFSAAMTLFFLMWVTANVAFFRPICRNMEKFESVAFAVGGHVVLSVIIGFVLILVNKFAPADTAHQVWTVMLIVYGIVSYFMAKDVAKTVAE